MVTSEEPHARCSLSVGPDKAIVACKGQLAYAVLYGTEDGCEGVGWRAGVTKRSTDVWEAWTKKCVLVTVKNKIWQ